MKLINLLLLSAATTTALAAVHTETSLDGNGWKFSRDSVRWTTVAVPHDWAISGPFDKKWDLQTVAIKENGEDVATEHSGRSGALPWIGRGYYRRTFKVPKNCGHAELVFDGAMADAHVYVNGHLAGHWAYGYNAFVVDITPYMKRGGDNRLEVSLNNLEESNRWYPGGGIYRPVKLVTTAEAAHLTTWGMDVVTTPDVEGYTVTVSHRLEGAAAGDATSYEMLVTIDGDNAASAVAKADAQGNLVATLQLEDPHLWCAHDPYLCNVTCKLYRGDRLVDEQTVRTGLRYLQWGKDVQGLTLNGERVVFRGVCLHHDLGPLGAAENRTAVLRQLEMMKQMGANAIRTSHNMPSTTMMQLCDSLGLMVMAESFDAWAEPKVRNGYNRLWNEWWQRDITNLITHHRTHPSIVMWSVGNEIPEQWKEVGAERYRGLVDLCHSLDPTRPVTCGMDNPDADIASGFAAQADVPGYNYRVHRYLPTFHKLPQGILMGSETTSTISSRGTYFFPDTCATNITWPKGHDGQCSSYDVEYCWWSNLPDDDWATQEAMAAQGMPFVGEFVWTGYDYLGEPTPYDEYWPSRSSYFGICDLAGLPKDRYWLYRSHWNKTDTTLHILPHWTWPGREGQVTPVYVYTNLPSAELFINGKSQGRVYKDSSKRLDRYRLRWCEVKYEPGEVRVVAYDSDNKPVAERTLRTAGAPARLRLEPERDVIAADGSDLCYVTVSLVDDNGTLCPDAANRLEFAVKGNGARYKAACNGDATSLEPFTDRRMSLFHGQLVVVLQSTGKPGPATLTVTDPATGLTATLPITAR